MRIFNLFSATEESDALVRPIPRWITIYGFFLLMVFFAFTITFAFYIKIPTAVRVKVHLSKQSVGAVFNFDQIEKVKKARLIRIRLPFIENQTVTGTLDFTKMSTTKENIIVPVTVDNVRIDSFLKNEFIDCEGEIIVHESSLVSLIRKRI